MRKLNRILLVKASSPWSAGETLADNTSALVPPLGLLYLASTLRRAFFDIEIVVLDIGLQPDGVDSVSHAAQEFRPDLIGISAMSIEEHTLFSAAERAADACPGAPIIAGGPHTNVEPHKILSESPVSVVVFGEGEATLVRLCRALAEEKDLADVPGIGFLHHGRFVKTKAHLFIENLDAMPFPAWDLIDLKRYSDTWNMQGYLKNMPYAPLFTSRGCPYHCAYCHNLFGKSIRLRSEQNVLAEIDFLVSTYGVSELHIYDDIFNIDRDRMTAICHGIKERYPGMAIGFPNAVRSDLLTESDLDTLVSAGTYSMSFAIESGSSRIQRLIGKNLSIDRAVKAIEYADERRILSHGYFMMGFPGETQQEIELTRDVACSSRLLFAHFFKVCPFPGTRLYDMVQAEGVRLRESYPDLCFDAPGVNYSTVPIEIFNKMHLDAYRVFYGNRRRMDRIKKILPSEIFEVVCLQFINYLEYPQGNENYPCAPGTSGDEKALEIIKQYVPKYA